MSKLGISINFIERGMNFLKRGSKKAAEEVKTITSTKTKTYIDQKSGRLVSEKEFLYPDGSKKMFRMFEGKNKDGSIFTETRVYGSDLNGEYYFGKGGDEGLSINRTRTITREKGASILGGDRVKIEKNYHETMGMTQHDETLIKEFNNAGELEHKELTLKYRHWDRPKLATQDKVFEGISLPHSAEDMHKISPANHREYLHTLDNLDNARFFPEGTTSAYSRAITARKQAEIDAAKETAAAAEAAKKAAEELAAKLPRMNIARILGISTDELKVTENILENGAIERIYTLPGTDKVAVKTLDHGILHKEWVYGGKQEMVYFKQIGKDEPYIVAKKGNFTQLRCLSKNKYTKKPVYINEQYYFDGVNSARRSWNGFSSKFEYGNTDFNIKMKNPTPAAERFPHEPEEYHICANYCSEKNNIKQAIINRMGPRTEEAKQMCNEASETAESIFDASEKSYIDLRNITEMFR